MKHVVHMCHKNLQMHHIQRISWQPQPDWLVGKETVIFSFGFFPHFLNNSIQDIDDMVIISQLRVSSTQTFICVSTQCKMAPCIPLEV